MPVSMGCWEKLTDFVRRATKDGFHVTDSREIYSGPDQEKGV